MKWHLRLFWYRMSPFNIQYSSESQNKSYKRTLLGSISVQVLHTKESPAEKLDRIEIIVFLWCIVATVAEFTKRFKDNFVNHLSLNQLSPHAQKMPPVFMDNPDPKQANALNCHNLKEDCLLKCYLYRHINKFHRKGQKTQLAHCKGSYKKKIG